MAFFILALFLLLFLMRLARWLAIVQQKEYRFDRLWLFHHTAEGLSEVVRILPKPHDFTRTGLKRPKLTGRVVIIGGTTVLVSTALFFSVLSKQSNPVDFLKVITGLYLLIPALVMLSLLPTVLVKNLFTFLELLRARKKIQQHHPLIIGITGSYGKTTTKHILHAVLSQKYSVFVTPKSFNTRYSVAQSIRKQYRNQELAIIEYAAYTKGEIKALAHWIQPDFALITGLTPQHIGLFGSLKNIILAKSELVKAVANPEHVFCNGADGGAMAICEAAGVMTPKIFGGTNSQVILKNTGLNSKGQLFFTWKSKKIQTSLIGKHYLEAIQAAILVAQQLKMSTEQIMEGLESIQVSELFVQTYKTKQGALVIDDGRTANQRGFEAALELLADMEHSGETFLITSGIIDLGSLSSQVHTILAQKARKIVSKVLYTGMEGKNEFQHVFGTDLISSQSDIQQILENVRKHDVILIEGKVPGWVKIAKKNTKS